MIVLSMFLQQKYFHTSHPPHPPSTPSTHTHSHMKADKQIIENNTSDTPMEQESNESNTNVNHSNPPPPNKKYHKCHVEAL